MRIKIAEMLKAQLNIEVDADSIHCNNAPPYRLMDLCRWCVDGTRDGGFVHVCSWDRMGDIIKSGGFAVVSDEYLQFEVCRK